MSFFRLLALLACSPQAPPRIRTTPAHCLDQGPSPSSAFRRLPGLAACPRCTPPRRNSDTPVLRRQGQVARSSHTLPWLRQIFPPLPDQSPDCYTRQRPASPSRSVGRIVPHRRICLLCHTPCPCR